MLRARCSTEFSQQTRTPGKETGDGIPEGYASPADVGAGGGPAGTAWKGVADVTEPLIVFEFK